jgi:hypothetical protein
MSSIINIGGYNVFAKKGSSSSASPPPPKKGKVGSSSPAPDAVQIPPEGISHVEENPIFIGFSSRSPRFSYI